MHLPYPQSAIHFVYVSVLYNILFNMSTTPFYPNPDIKIEPIKVT